MSSRRTLWTVVAVTAVVAALVGGGTVWAAQRSAAARADATIAAARAAASTQADEIARLEAAAASATSAPTTPTSSTPPTPTAAPTSTVVPVPAKAARQFAFVTKAALSGSKASLTADYAQFLTGPAATAAATAHHDESPPPNDYYVVNDNAALRKLPVKTGISVKLVSKPDGTVEVAGYRVSLATWVSYYMSPSASTTGITGAWYWLTLKGGTVVGIEEQYVP